MAAVNGENYTKEFITIPKDVSNIGEFGGRKKVIFDTIAAAASGDVLSFGKIPAGARVLNTTYLGAGVAADEVFSVAAGDKIASEAELTCTLPSDHGAGQASAFVEYILD